MENIPPEDWPRVLANVHRAVRPGGAINLTVEEGPVAVVDAAFDSLAQRGLPAVRGEVIEDGFAGYHDYPGRERVLRWIAAERLDVVAEEYEDVRDGWGYRHFLLRATAEAG